MIVDLVIVAIVFLVALLRPSKAAALVAFQHSVTWVMIYMFLVGSGFWNIQYLGNYHLLCAMFNGMVTVILCVTCARWRLLIISSALLTLSNVTVYFAVNESINSFDRQVILLFPYLHLLLVSLQITGLFNNDSGNNRQNGKRARITNLMGAIGRHGGYSAILPTKIHQ